MENKVNIAELLKDCPKGMELYSPLCGKCVFDCLNMGTIICKKQNNREITFTSKGYYMLPVFDNCECMIFPSKDQRDWSKFQRPFKDGDIIATDLGSVFILKSCLEDKIHYHSYFGVTCCNGIQEKQTPFAYKDVCHLATEEEKEKLFKVIKDKGYHWNDETKTLEELPKFKIGNTIRLKKNHNYIYTITGIREKENKYECGVTFVLRVSEQDNWELVPDKFDITTLKPFESRVLVRNDESQRWLPAFWGYKVVDGFITTFGWCKYCIPYKGNEILFKTNNDCDDYFKTWQE